MVVPPGAADAGPACLARLTGLARERSSKTRGAREGGRGVSPTVHARAEVIVASEHGAL